MRQVLPVEFDLDAILALPEPEKSAQLNAVAAYKRKVDENPLWAFRPHEGEKQRKLEAGEALTGEESRGQVEFLEMNWRKVRIGAVTAGNRFGKSEIGAVDNLIQLLPPAFVPPWLEVYRRRRYNGDFRCRTVVPDEKALNTVWLPKLRKRIPEAALFGGSWRKAYNAKDRIIRFADESWWDFLTHGMDVGAFAGADLDRVHFDEEPPGELGKQQFEESRWRILDRAGDIRFTLTPLGGYTWLYHTLSERNAPRKDDEVYVVEGSIDDNPAMPEDEVKAVIAYYEKNDPARLESRRRGRFVHFAGLILPDFRKTSPPDGHVVPDRDLPRHAENAKPLVPVYESIDPGIDHPAALVFFWLSSEDVAEVFFAQKWAQLATVDEFVEKRNTVLAALNFTPRWTVIDPSARNRNWQTGRNLQDVLRRDHGINTIPGQNAMSPGISEIRQRLQTGRIVFHAEGAADLIDEIPKYRWKNTKSRSEDEPKQEPIKANDDCLDALRYGLMSLPTAAKAPDQTKPSDWNDPRRRLIREDLKRRLNGSRRQRVGTSRR